VTPDQCPKVKHGGSGSSESGWAMYARVNVGCNYNSPKVLDLFEIEKGFRRTGTVRVKDEQLQRTYEQQAASLHGNVQLVLKHTAICSRFVCE